MSWPAPPFDASGYPTDAESPPYPLGTHRPRWMVASAGAGRVHPEMPPQYPHDGQDAAGPSATNPYTAEVGINVAGLHSFASNGETVIHPGVPTVPIEPAQWPAFRGSRTEGANQYRPTTSVFLNDLRTGWGRARHAQPVAGLTYDHSAVRQTGPRWGHMRPQPISRPQLHKPHSKSFFTRLVG